MDRQALPSPYPYLAEVRKCLDAWRRTRPGLQPTPEEFWSEAAALCSHHPFHAGRRRTQQDFFPRTSVERTPYGLSIRAGLGFISNGTQLSGATAGGVGYSEFFK